MVSVRPDEVSAILREQLSGSKSAAELEEVGTVLQIGDGVARIYGLSKVQAGELLVFENGLKALALNLEEDNVGAVLLGESKEVHEGDTVKRTGLIGSVKVGDGVLGRGVNGLARLEVDDLFEHSLADRRAVGAHRARGDASLRDTGCTLPANTAAHRVEG